LSWAARGCRRGEEADEFPGLPPPGESDLEVLAASPLLQRLGSLEFNYMTLMGDAGDFNPGLVAIAESPHAAGLTTLGLYNKGPPWETLRLLGNSPCLPRLAEMDLGANGLTDEHLGLLASLPIAGRLRRVGLTWNHQLRAAGVRRLLDACRLKDLSLEVT